MNLSGLPCYSKQICSKGDKLLTEWTWDPETEILGESKPEMCASWSTLTDKWTVSLREKQSNYIKDIGKTNKQIYVNVLLCCDREGQQCHLSAGEKSVADQALLLQSQQKQQEVQERLQQCTLTWGLGSTADLAEGVLGLLGSGLMELKHTCTPVSLDA